MVDGASRADTDTSMVDGATQTEGASKSDISMRDGGTSRISSPPKHEFSSHLRR